MVIKNTCPWNFPVSNTYSRPLQGPDPGSIQISALQGQLFTWATRPRNNKWLKHIFERPGGRSLEQTLSGKAATVFLPPFSSEHALMESELVYVARGRLVKWWGAPHPGSRSQPVWWRHWSTGSLRLGSSLSPRAPGRMEASHLNNSLTGRPLWEGFLLRPVSTPLIPPRCLPKELHCMCTSSLSACFWGAATYGPWSVCPSQTLSAHELLLLSCCYIPPLPGLEPKCPPPAFLPLFLGPAFPSGSSNFSSPHH